ncbi:MAG: transglycosylase SLT domain-containing protein [Acidobacteriota bacterium]|nr:MAG: transglycosylase SLT domain-containing protein [Acidobacteriota bacterium]
MSLLTCSCLSTQRSAASPRGGRIALIGRWRKTVLLTCLAAASCDGDAALARQRVEFADTRLMDVVSAVREGDMYVLDLGNGSSVRVPAVRVVDVRPAPVRRGGQPPARQRSEPWRAQAGDFVAHIEQAAERYQLEPHLLVAVAVVESALDPLALSPKGAQGVMQIMPRTAEELGLKDPFDPAANIDAGARFLRQMLDAFSGNLELALAAYNAGEGAVRHYGGVPPYPETVSYLDRIRSVVARFETAGL